MSSVPALNGEHHPVALQSATITWPHDRGSGDDSNSVSAASTPRRKFILVDLTLDFPLGELSLVCGKLGSGKTLLLLGTSLGVARANSISNQTMMSCLKAILGEADLLAGQIACPRSPPDILASFAGINAAAKDWIVPGVCAYVPQVRLL